MYTQEKKDMNRDINIEDFFDTAREVALSYGFESLDEAIKASKTKKRKVRSINSLKGRTPAQTEIGYALRHYLENQFDKTEEPIFTFFSNIDKNTSKYISSSKIPKNANFTVAVLGQEIPFSEALLISCTKRITEEVYKDKNLRININSIGDKPSFTRFSQEFKHYFRKKMCVAPEECIRLFNNNPVDAYKYIQENEKCEEIKENTPSPMKYLSNQSKKHFSSILEYLEENKIPYHLSNDLIEHPQYCCHSVYEIKNQRNETLATGYRCDPLSNLLYRRQVPGAYMTITINEKTLGTYDKKKRNRKSKVFLIHSGDTPRQKALSILNQLREEKVPVDHKLHMNTVDEQIKYSEKGKYPFLLIIGVQEIRDGKARVRNTINQKQELIEIDKIPNFLKRIRNLH